MAKKRQPEQEPEPDQQPEQPPEPVEWLDRWTAVHRAIGEVDGDTTYGEIIERAQELLRACGDEDADHRTLWNVVEKAMTSLVSLGLVECEWEVHVHPLRPGRLGNGR
jgi:hypothetical protein